MTILLTYRKQNFYYISVDYKYLEEKELTFLIKTVKMSISILKATGICYLIQLGI